MTHAEQNAEKIREHAEQHPLLDRLRGRHFIPGVDYVSQAQRWMSEAADAIEWRDADLERLRPLSDLFADIVHEADRAHEKHGDTSMRSQPWHEHRRVTILTEEVGEVAKALNDRHHHAEGDTRTVAELRGELVQVGAMVLDWIRALDEISKPCSYCQGAGSVTGRPGASIDGYRLRRVCPACAGTKIEIPR